MNLSKKLKQLREEKNLSLQQLADKTNISKPVLWQYETGKTIPSTEVIKKLATFYNVSTDYLIFDNFEDNNESSLLNTNFIKKISSIFKTNSKYKKHIEEIVDILYDKNQKTD